MSIKDILEKAKGMVIDGIAASEHIDSSGEILDVDGCDISDIHDGVAVLNYEHKDETPTDVVGRIIFGKKIFSEKDCEDERQLMYWKKSGVPYIYIIGELMDADGHYGAKDLAAIFRYYKSRELPIITRFSIEGSTLEKVGNRLKKSIFKRCAITIKPCNKDATSGVLFDPTDKKPKKDDIRSVVEKITEKFEHPSYSRLPGAVDIECMPLLELEKALPEESQKNNNVLQENTLPDKDLLKNKIMGLLKDWNGDGDFKEFVKFNLPEVSDEFLDKFTELVDDFKIKKIKKFERLEKTLQKSSNLKLGPALLEEEVEEKKNDGPPPVHFNNKHIIPGQATVKINNNRSPHFVMDFDPKNKKFVILPKDKINGWHESDLKVVPWDKNSSATIHSFPKPVLPKDMPLVIDSKTHAPDTLSPEEKELVHGIDLNKNYGKPDVNQWNEESFWTKNGAGQMVYVKPTVLAKEEFTDAKREYVYYKTAKDFFGLGQYLPIVSQFNHPITNEPYAAIQGVQNGEHDPDIYKHTQHKANLVSKLGHTGELDKLALMNFILGNNDRHQWNMLFTHEPPHLKLIDHGFSFDWGEGQIQRPGYNSIEYNRIFNRWAKGYFDERYAFGAPLEDDPTLLEHQPINPAAKQWIESLDPATLVSHLQKHGTPVEYAQDAGQALAVLKLKLSKEPNITRTRLFQPLRW